MHNTVTLATIRDAVRHIDPVFLDSPVTEDARLNAALRCHAVAKVEIDNPIGSFKGRGTECFVASALAAGEAVVCASAGNFGQGLARAARRRGHSCTVFAAATASPLKIEAMRRLGADVRLAGADFDAAKKNALGYATGHGMRYVEDGAEPAIADGAGTIGLELAQSVPFDVVVVQLGNGALLTGVGTAVRSLVPGAKVIGVVAERAPAMKLSLEAGRVVETPSADTIADGIAVRVPIPETLRALRNCCDDVVAVTEEQIFAALRLIYRTLEMIVEPAGAAGIAAILADPGRFADQRVAVILSGGNISNALYQQVLA